MEINKLQAKSFHVAYRADIDGLRAFAVMAVLIYHAFPPYLSSGYIGVDVFFVISGYLISSIILNGAADGTLQFRHFYISRMKRLLPALLLVMVTCYGFGWLVMLTSEYMQLSQHIIANALLIYNFFLHYNIGYFSPEAKTQPLLHLWSLAIEAQYYLFWPMVLWGLIKARLAPLLVSLLLASVSFYLCVEWAGRNPFSSFYLPHMRMWELLTGSALACWMARNSAPLSAVVANVLAIIGVLLLCYALYVLNHRSVFPNAWALLPVLGTALIIVAGPASWFNRYVLSARPFVWLGLISYPLYLWHWPLLSFAHITHSGIMDFSTRTVCMALALVLATFTYKFIEIPARRSAYRIYRPEVLIFALACMVAVSVHTYQKNGIGSRMIARNAMLNIIGRDRTTDALISSGCGIARYLQKNFPECFSDNRGNVKYALLGDSKAGVLFPGLVRTSSEAGRWLIIGGYGYSAPVPVLSDNTIYRRYQAITTVALDALAQNTEIKVVVFAVSVRLLFMLRNDRDLEDLPTTQNFDVVLEGLSAAVGKLTSAGKKVILLVDNPTLPPVTDCIIRRSSIDMLNKLLIRPNPACELPLDRYKYLTANYTKLLTGVQQRYPKDVEIFDATSRLCNTQRGVCTHKLYGVQLYNVSDHLSDWAAGLIGSDLNTFLRNNY